MKNQVPEPHWRSLTVDALIGATVLTLALAAMQAAAGLDYLLPIAVSILLVGSGWVVESDVASFVTDPFQRLLAWHRRSAPRKSAPAEDKDTSDVDAIGLVAMPPYMVQ